METGPALLKTWRATAGMSQAVAADRVGVSQNTWSDWENGEKSPRVNQCLKLHVLTVGACPVWSWSDDPDTCAELARMLSASHVAPLAVDPALHPAA